MALSQSIINLEASVLNFARQDSLQTRRKNSNYTFSEISIPVTTKYNNSRIILHEEDIRTEQQWFFWVCAIIDDDGEKKITNTCLFYSIEIGRAHV